MDSSSSEESSRSCTSASARTGKINSKSNRKSSILLVTSSVLCLVTVRNFVQDATSLKGRSLAASYYMTEVQTTFVHDYMDLQLLEQERQELFMTAKDESKDMTEEIKEVKERSKSMFVPLADYVPPKSPPPCPYDMFQAPLLIHPPVHNTNNNTTTVLPPSKIPRIIHMTGFSSCVTKPFYDGMLQWQRQLPDYDFYFHNEAAVDALLFERHWPEFPQLANTMQCLQQAGGAAKADLWRYLALYEYGGLYTDMDNLPGEFMNMSTIGPDVDAFFLREKGGWLSQYFFAVAPKHPLMFLAVHDVMKEMHNLEDTGNFYVPQKTGPGATKRAFLYFMGIDSTSSEQDINLYSKPPAGTYYYSHDNHNHNHHHIHGNRTVTVVGTRRTCDQWVVRSALGGSIKREGWKRMNITSYQGLNQEASGQSCLVRLHNYYYY